MFNKKINLSTLLIFALGYKVIKDSYSKDALKAKLAQCEEKINDLKTTLNSFYEKKTEDNNDISEED